MEQELWYRVYKDGLLHCAFSGKNAAIAYINLVEYHSKATWRLEDGNGSLIQWRGE